MIRVAVSGTWLYDGTVTTTVRVIETDFDFWYAVGEADGQLEDGELPQLNEHGLLYYVCNKPGWDPSQPFWPDSQGFMNVEDAKTAAEAQIIASPVSWS
jgi:hypothetical protein